MLAFSDSTVYNFIVKVYIEIAGLSSFAGSACSPYSSIEQTAFGMKQRYFNEHPDYTILRTENGRPYFAHTETLFFSGSHTKKSCITVMAEKNIAVDIEQCRPKHFQSIAEYAFTETEQQWLAQSKAVEKDFFLLWTIKEADIKLHGSSVFSIKDAVHINLIEKTAFAGSLEKDVAQYGSPISGTVLHKRSTPESAAYPHSIFSFYLTKTSPERTVHFVISIIIAGHDTDIEFVWSYATEPHTHITAEPLFAYPAQRA